MAKHETIKEDEAHIKVKLDPEKKKMFKMYCVLKDITQTDFILHCIDTAIKEVEPA